LTNIAKDYSRLSRCFLNKKASSNKKAYQDEIIKKA